jgi:hypothetical protein
MSTKPKASSIRNFSLAYKELGNLAKLKKNLSQILVYHPYRKSLEEQRHGLDIWKW